MEIIDEILEKALQERREAAKKERARQWASLKKQSPETARFLILLNEKFGKPAHLSVQIGNEFIIKKR